MEITLLITLCIIGIIIHFLRKWFLEGYKGADGSNIKRNINKPKYSLSNINITESNTTYQAIGTEERIIDNSKNDGLVRRKLIISREWKKSVSVDEEVTRTLKAKIGLPYNMVNSEISNSIKNKYGIIQNETKYFSEEVELEIGAHSKIILHINWKVIWQNGEIEVLSNQNNKVKIPFKIIKGITFDQIQEKIN